MATVRGSVAAGIQEVLEEEEGCLGDREREFAVCPDGTKERGRVRKKERKIVALKLVFYWKSFHVLSRGSMVQILRHQLYHCYTMVFLFPL